VAEGDVPFFYTRKEVVLVVNDMWTREVAAG